MSERAGERESAAVPTREASSSREKADAELWLGELKHSGGAP